MKPLQTIHRPSPSPQPAQGARRVGHAAVAAADFRDDASDDLAPLLAAAATLDLCDGNGGTRLRQQAHRVTSRLVAAGRLPDHLLVELDDPPVVVARTLAVAWQRTIPSAEAPRSP